MSSYPKQNPFTQVAFAAVIDLPARDQYEVFDFTQNYDPNRAHLYEYGIGRYNEKRPHNMYTGPQYENARNIHMGVDIMAPLQTEIKTFADGEIFLFQNNAQEFDYGYTIITKHLIQNINIYALFGHLAKKSFENKKIGQKIQKGETIAFIGDKSENGGWNPHLHFQISFEEPLVADMPGVVCEKDLSEALLKFPDPRWILGPIY